MSNIDITAIDNDFPVQGKDNNSQGFRTNFTAIKTALNIAKTEITTLQTNTAKTNTTNNFNGNRLENFVLNNISDLYKNKGTPEDQQISIDVRDAKVFKIRCTGNTTVSFTNWPQNTLNLTRATIIKLHIIFDLNLADPNINEYRVNFSTGLGGIIKSTPRHLTNWTDGPTGWYLPAQLKQGSGPNPTINNQEHVLEAWTYNNGQTIFLNYLGNFG
jgi:hypothetical protein